MPDAPEPVRPRRRFGDRTLAACAVAAVVAAILASHAPTAAASSPVLEVHTAAGGLVVDSPTVTVNGVGTVMGTPDTLTVSMQCTSSASHASAAIAQNNQLTATLIASLTSAGATLKDISTNDLTIQPQYDNQGRSISGYTVTEAVAVTLHDLSKAGAILDSAATSVGDAVRVNGMSLSISDDSALLATARTQAVAEAKKKASDMATGAGVTLGSVKSISEGSTPVQWSAQGASRMDAAAAAVPVSPGQQQLTVTVSVVYSLNG